MLIFRTALKKSNIKKCNAILQYNFKSLLINLLVQNKDHKRTIAFMCSLVQKRSRCLPLWKRFEENFRPISLVLVYKKLEIFLYLWAQGELLSSGDPGVQEPPRQPIPLMTGWQGRSAASEWHTEEQSARAREKRVCRWVSPGVCRSKNKAQPFPYGKNYCSPRFDEGLGLSSVWGGGGLYLGDQFPVSRSSHLPVDPGLATPGESSV